MSVVTTKEPNQPGKNTLFATVDLPSGRLLTIYGFMPAKELKQLIADVEEKLTSNPNLDIPRSITTSLRS